MNTPEPAIPLATSSSSSLTEVSSCSTSPYHTPEMPPDDNGSATTTNGAVLVTLAAVGGVVLALMALSAAVAMSYSIIHRKRKARRYTSTQRQPLQQSMNSTPDTTLSHKAQLQLQLPGENTIASNQDFEISSRTWSAYETLPADMPLPPHENEIKSTSRTSVDKFTFTEEPGGDTEQVPVLDAIHTVDNSAYANAVELLLEGDSGEYGTSQSLLQPPITRLSILSNSTTNSGYVINSLRSSSSRPRLSCYSSSSEGYVINQLDYTALPCQSTITEGAADYLKIIPS